VTGTQQTSEQTLHNRSHLTALGCHQATCNSAPISVPDCPVNGHGKACSSWQITCQALLHHTSRWTDTLSRCKRTVRSMPQACKKQECQRTCASTQMCQPSPSACCHTRQRHTWPETPQSHAPCPGAKSAQI